MSLKSNIENHAAIIFGGVAITSFVFGIGAFRGFIEASSQTIITKDRERVLLKAEQKLEEAEKELRELRLQLIQRSTAGSHVAPYTGASSGKTDQPTSTTRPPPATSPPSPAASEAPQQIVRPSQGSGNQPPTLDPDPVKETLVVADRELARFKDGNTIASRQSWASKAAELVVNGELIAGHSPPGKAFPVKSPLGEGCAIVYGGFVQPTDRPKGRYLQYSLICRTNERSG